MSTPRPLRFLCWSILCVLPVISACGKREPIRVGFVAGLSGRVADLGVAGRNGAILAMEERNAAGGIGGRPIELLIRDDEQNPEKAKQVVSELLGQNLEVIIGPMTSSMAMTMLPLVNASQTILVSPTVTTTDLQGKDDNFLRVISVTTEYASKNARYQYEKLGRRKTAVLYDTKNSSYTLSWLNDFRKTFTELGGTIIREQPFQSSDEGAFSAIVSDVLAAGPDLVLTIANAVDAAIICQQVRKQNPSQAIVMAEWASTERFAELAGTASEEVYVSQFLDRNDPSPRYQNFLKAYRERFGLEPGFAGLAGYDAALVVLEAYAKRKSGQSLKEAIITQSAFPCLQQTITIDRYGDANRKTFLTVIRNGQYLNIE